jgi:transcriptional regulator with XRE-family HTH domain
VPHKRPPPDDLVSDYLRKRALEIVGTRDKPGSMTRVDLARKLSVTKGWITQWLNDERTAGDKVRKGMRALLNMSGDEIENAAEEYGRSIMPADRVVRTDGAPVFGNLPGWHEAETQARALRRYRHISQEGWEAARELRGAKAPAQITPELVGDLADTMDRAIHGEGLDLSDDD